MHILAYGVSGGLERGAGSVRYHDPRHMAVERYNSGIWLIRFVDSIGFIHLRGAVLCFCL